MGFSRQLSFIQLKAWVGENALFTLALLNPIHKHLLCNGNRVLQVSNLKMT